MTYREAIQIQIKAMQEIYDNANGLRDIASDQFEKECFNNIRRYMPILWNNLQRADNSLTDAAAAYKCKGNYEVVVNLKTVS